MWFTLGGKSLQGWLRDIDILDLETLYEVYMQAFQNGLGFSLYAALSVCCVVVTSEDRTKSKGSEC